MAFLPAVLAVAGAAYQGVQQSNALKYNSQVMGNEQDAANAQGVQQEGIVRNNSRESLGRQIAAFGSAGVGYGGSSRTALDQSAVNMEKDALNTRYKAALSGYGYGAQAGIDSDAANTASANVGLMAGAALLKNLGPTYAAHSSIAPSSESDLGLSGQTLGYA